MKSRVKHIESQTDHRKCNFTSDVWISLRTQESRSHSRLFKQTRFHVSETDLLILINFSTIDFYSFRTCFCSLMC